MNYVEMHVGDYSAATFHLSPLEDGIYWRLLRCYYRDERPLPPDMDQVARMAGARQPDEIEAVGIVLSEFFRLESDGWHQVRCDAEIERYRIKSEKARASAAASWESRKPNAERSQSERIANASVIHKDDANAMRSHSDGNAHQTPDTRHHKRSPPTPRGGAADRFSDFWLTWPKNERKQDKAKCLDYWSKNGLDQIADQILDDVRTKRGTRKWAEGFVETPLIYLRGRRWEDEVQPEKPEDAAQFANWRDTRQGIEAKGVELGLGKWDEDAFNHSRPGSEHFQQYRARVERAADGNVDPEGVKKIASIVGAAFAGRKTA